MFELLPKAKLILKIFYGYGGWYSFRRFGHHDLRGADMGWLVGDF